MKTIYVINKQGFADWNSTRAEPDNYIPKANEIDTPIPIDTPWYEPRWDGKDWVESGEVPELMPQMPPIPNENQILGQQITDLEISDIIHGQQATDMEIRILSLEAKLNV